MVSTLMQQLSGGYQVGRIAKRSCLVQQDKEGEEQVSDRWLMACRSLQRHAQIYDRAQPVAHGHQSHVLIDHFIIYTPPMDGAQLWRESMRALQEESWCLLPILRCVCVAMGHCVSSRRRAVNANAHMSNNWSACRQQTISAKPSEYFRIVWKAHFQQWF